LLLNTEKGKERNSRWRKSDDDDKGNTFISGSLNDSVSSSSGYTEPSVTMINELYERKSRGPLKVEWTEESHENLVRSVGIRADI
jgi:hypothetical protein